MRELGSTSCLDVIGSHGVLSLRLLLSPTLAPALAPLSAAPLTATLALLTAALALLSAALALLATALAAAGLQVDQHPARSAATAADLHRQGDDSADGDGDRRQAASDRRRGRKLVKMK